MTENRPLRVFLCHSSHDKPIVRDLFRRLDAEGWIDAWLDVENFTRARIGILRLKTRWRRRT